MDYRLEKNVAAIGSRSVVKRKNSTINIPNKKPRLQSRSRVLVQRATKKNHVAAPKHVKRRWSERTQELKESKKVRKCWSLTNNNLPVEWSQQISTPVTLVASADRLSTCYRGVLELSEPSVAGDEKNSNDVKYNKDPKTLPEDLQQGKEKVTKPSSDLSMFEIGDVLGKGAFGEVYEAKRKSDDRTVALKFLHRNKIPVFKELDGGESVPEEVFYHSKVHHPAIIELLDYFWAEDTFVMVMEKPTASCDLLDYVSMCGTLDEEEARKIFEQVLEATIHCEERGIFHRDIKSENIILDIMSEDVVKLTDFGLSSTAQEEPYDHFRGTRDFCPPEFFTSHQYHATHATVWQLGCLLVDVLSMSLPYDNPKDAVTKPPFIPGNVSREAQDLIRKMLAREGSARPSLMEIKQHPWLQRH